MATDSFTREAPPPASTRWRRARHAAVGLAIVAASAALASLIWFPAERDDSRWLERFRFLEKVRHNGGEVAYTHDANPYARLSDWVYWKTRRRLPGSPRSPLVPGSEHIVRLCLVGATVTNADLRFIEDFTRLQELTVKETAIDDEGLRHLSALNQLTSLVLDGPFTDAGLQSLAGLEDLEQLQLIGARLEAAGLGHLRSLPRLWNLSFEGGQATGEALEPIGGLKSLTQLSLSGSQITDAGLEHVGRLHNLRHLQLDRTPITDLGLGYLGGMTSLQSLSLRSTSVTSNGVRTLKKSLPKLRVYQ